ncbi:MAG: hypothetical protein U5L96_06190 [Owenweeksia sp.]|nr:hypothetical protein [Owenweeksia sp.]
MLNYYIFLHFSPQFCGISGYASHLMQNPARQDRSGGEAKTQEAFNEIFGFGKAFTKNAKPCASCLALRDAIPLGFALFL